MRSLDQWPDFELAGSEHGWESFVGMLLLVCGDDLKTVQNISEAPANVKYNLRQSSLRMLFVYVGSRGAFVTLSVPKGGACGDEILFAISGRSLGQWPDFELAGSEHGGVTSNCVFLSAMTIRRQSKIFQRLRPM